MIKDRQKDRQTDRPTDIVNYSRMHATKNKFIISLFCSMVTKVRFNRPFWGCCPITNPRMKLRNPRGTRNR